VKAIFEFSAVGEGGIRRRGRFSRLLNISAANTTEKADARPQDQGMSSGTVSGICQWQGSHLQSREWK
jgi:hypothetical protein